MTRCDCKMRIPSLSAIGKAADHHALEFVSAEDATTSAGMALRSIIAVRMNAVPAATEPMPIAKAGVKLLAEVAADRSRSDSTRGRTSISPSCPFTMWCNPRSAAPLILPSATRGIIVSPTKTVTLRDDSVATPDETDQTTTPDATTRKSNIDVFVDQRNIPLKRPHCRVA